MGPCVRRDDGRVFGFQFQRADTPSRSRGAVRPRFAVELPAHKNQRAQGRPGARCTRGLVCNCAQRTRTRAYRFSGNIPAFPAQWLDGLLRALPGERLFCHRRLRTCHRKLDASTAASGPHDFAVRFMRATSRAFRVHRISPRVRDDRDPPLVTGETRGVKSLICPTARAEYFCARYLDRLLLICPSGCSVAESALALEDSPRHSGACEDRTMMCNCTS